MEIVRRVTASRRTLVLTVRVSLSDREMELAKRFGLLRYRVKTKDGRFSGVDAVPRNLRSAYRVQIGRVKNRWSAALVRTSSLSVFDFVSSLTDFLAGRTSAFLNLFFGRRKTFKMVLTGITVASPRVEVIKEAEFFILVSVAALGKALQYLGELDKEVRCDFDALLAEVDGLDFAGAGSNVESELEAIRSMISGSNL